MPNPADFDLRESNGYLSRHKGYLNAMQRERRQRNPRIDYSPSREAMAAIRARLYPAVGGTLSAVIDALVLAGAAELPEQSSKK